MDFTPGSPQNGCDPSVSSLVSGIVSDFGTLLEQQFALLRAEIQHTATTDAVAVSKHMRHARPPGRRR